MVKPGHAFGCCHPGHKTCVKLPAANMALNPGGGRARGHTRIGQGQRRRREPSRAASSPALIAQTTSSEWADTPVRWCPLNSPTAALMGGAPIPCDGGTEKPFSAAVARPGAVVTGKRPTRFCAGAVRIWLGGCVEKPRKRKKGGAGGGFMGWPDASGSGFSSQLSEPIRYRACE